MNTLEVIGVAWMIFGVAILIAGKFIDGMEKARGFGFVLVVVGILLLFGEEILTREVE